MAELIKKWGINWVALIGAKIDGLIDGNKGHTQDFDHVNPL